MAQAKAGDTVRVHYHGKLTDGTTFDSSEGRSPLEFTVGQGMVIPGFDNALPGMEIGEKKTVKFTLKPVDLEILDKDMNWTVEPGDFQVLIGSSSEDIRLTKDFEIIK